MDQEPSVIKEATCPSLSAQSALTYQIGNTPDGTIHIRIVGNSGNGYFNGYWVSLPEILAVLNDQDGPFTWEALRPLFEGRSVNSACFLMAALKNEGLVKQSKEQPRRYERGDPTSFEADIKALIAMPKPTKGGAVKKPAANVDPEEPTQDIS